MCGVCGAIALNSKVEGELAVRRMLAAIVHRGPDEEGFGPDVSDRGERKSRAGWCAADGRSDPCRKASDVGRRQELRHSLSQRRVEGRRARRATLLFAEAVSWNGSQSTIKVLKSCVPVGQTTVTVIGTRTVHLELLTKTLI